MPYLSAIFVLLRQLLSQRGGGEGLPPADGDRVAGAAHGSAPGGGSPQRGGERGHPGEHRPVGPARRWGSTGTGGKGLGDLKLLGVAVSPISRGPPLL